MSDPTAPKRHQITGNAGLNYAAWQLSRRGWNVMPTIRNARGSDLIVTNADETVFFGVQSKALSKRNAVPLGLTLNHLRSDWWVITINVNTERPTCYVMTLAEVKQRAVQDKNGGAWWLNPPGYDQDDYREAWHRIGSGSSAKEPPALPVTPPARGSLEVGRALKRELIPEQNGIRRPKPDTLCGKAWAIFDSISTNSGSPAKISEALKIARQQGLNEGNVRAEFYQWRKFHSGRTIDWKAGPDR